MRFSTLTGGSRHHSLCCVCSEGCPLFSFGGSLPGLGYCPHTHTDLYSPEFWMGILCRFLEFPLCSSFQSKTLCFKVGPCAVVSTHLHLLDSQIFPWWGNLWALPGLPFPVLQQELSCPDLGHLWVTPLLLLISGNTYASCFPVSENCCFLYFSHLSSYLQWECQ